MASIKVNGTKTISDLAAVTAINDADVFLIEVGGVTKKVTGATLKSLIAASAVNVDNTLSVNGDAADAKATGDAILSAQGIIANEFDDTETYDVGDYVRYEGKLYKFTAAHEVGDFDQNEVAEVVVVNEMVKDVQVDGTSVVSGGVAEIPYATSASAGIVRTHASYGTAVTNTGMIYIVPAASNNVKEGNTNSVPLTPGRQHESTFYGLAKAAGDTTQSASSNTVGNYTDNAKSAIKAMLGVGGETQTVSVSGTAPVIVANQNTRYVCGEVTSLDFTPSAAGICDVIFTSGSTVAVLTIPNTVVLPSWFDPTSLEVNTTYEINIADGVYGSVMIW